MIVSRACGGRRSDRSRFVDRMVEEVTSNETSNDSKTHCRRFGRTNGCLQVPLWDVLVVLSLSLSPCHRRTLIQDNFELGHSNDVILAGPHDVSMLSLQRMRS